MTLDDIKESAAMAVNTVRGNKLRSSLTILGVATTTEFSFRPVL